MISFDEAFELVRREVRLMTTEKVRSMDYPGRVLARDVVSPIDLPVFDNSAVDGYAIHGSDLGAKRLVVTGESRAGSPEGLSVSPGVCARVFTGAPIPSGTAAVVMQEDVVRSGDSIILEDVAKAGAHVRGRGEEIRSGDTVVTQGTLLTPGAVGAICSTGVLEVEAFRRPLVEVLVTGDELQTVGRPLKPGQIYDSNCDMLRTAIIALGLEDTSPSEEKDDPKKLRKRLAGMLDVPVLITSGGISVGDHDYLRSVLTDLGVVEVFWKVAMKPGKPVYFGRHDQGVVFGLPGNPVSALTCFALFVRPYLRAIQGLPFEHDTCTVEVGLDIEKSPGREELVPGVILGDKIEPMVGRASHKPSCMATANALLRIPAATTKVKAGERLSAIRLNWGM